MAFSASPHCTCAALLTAIPPRRLSTDSASNWPVLESENNQVPLICDLAPTPIVYKRNFLIRGDEFNKEDGAIDFDVVAELIFSDRAAYLAWADQLSKPGSGEQVAADEDPSDSRIGSDADATSLCLLKTPKAAKSLEFWEGSP